MFEFRKYQEFTKFDGARNLHGDTYPLPIFENLFFWFIWKKTSNFRICEHFRRQIHRLTFAKSTLTPNCKGQDLERPLVGRHFSGIVCEYTNWTSDFHLWPQNLPTKWDWSLPQEDFGNWYYVHILLILYTNININYIEIDIICQWDVWEEPRRMTIPALPILGSTAALSFDNRSNKSKRSWWTWSWS